MLPENVPSSIGLGGAYLPPDQLLASRLEDFERGGVAINDASQGLMVRDWRAFVRNDFIVVEPVTRPQDGIEFVYAPELNELSLAFDQNMRPAVTYRMADETINLRWFDNTTNQYRVDNFGPGRNPRLCLDDKRMEMSSSSDIILAYLRDNGLFYRQQRDRFQIERTLQLGLSPKLRLKNIGMNRNLRLQCELV